MKVSKYLTSHLVLFLDVTTQEEVFAALVNQLDQAGKLKDKAAFHKAILDREKIVSTGIGMGVAIPHAKLDHYDDFFIAIAILKKGIDWHALDGSPVRLVFMIGGPDDKQTEYLQILSGLTNAVKDEERRKKMLTLNSPSAIIELFELF
jgi:PTS system nitrogen regulatory IIA component